MLSGEVSKAKSKKADAARRFLPLQIGALPGRVGDAVPVTGVLLLDLPQDGGRSTPPTFCGLQRTGLVDFDRTEVSVAEKTRDIEAIRIERPASAKVSGQGALEKMKGFGKRKGRFVAAIRKSED